MIEPYRHSVKIVIVPKYRHTGPAAHVVQSHYYYRILELILKYNLKPLYMSSRAKRSDLLIDWADTIK